MKYTNSELQTYDWKDTLNISPKFISHNRDITDIFILLSEDWDAQLGTIKTVKHKI